MPVDDVVKLLLAGSFSFAIIGISYGLIRFILKATDILQDVRKPVQNVGVLSDLALEDYKNIRGVITSITNTFQTVNSYVENPVKLFKNLFGIFRGSSDSKL